MNLLGFLGTTTAIIFIIFLHANQDADMIPDARKPRHVRIVYYTLDYLRKATLRLYKLDYYTISLMVKLPPKVGEVFLVDTDAPRSDRESDCHICYDSMKSPGNILQTHTSCGHSWHKDCLDMWFCLHPDPSKKRLMCMQPTISDSWHIGVIKTGGYKYYPLLTRLTFMRFMLLGIWWASAIALCRSFYAPGGLVTLLRYCLQRDLIGMTFAAPERGKVTAEQESAMPIGRRVSSIVDKLGLVILIRTMSQSIGGVWWSPLWLFESGIFAYLVLEEGGAIEKN